MPALLSEVKDGPHHCSSLHFRYNSDLERRGRRKEFVRGATEVKDCLEEKAGVKIKNRISARVVQTGAGAMIAE